MREQQRTASDSSVSPSTDTKSSTDDSTTEGFVPADGAQARPIELEAPGARVLVTPLPSGRNRVRVQRLDETIVIKFSACETAYDLDLIRLILEKKGPGHLCDEIARDESPQYTGAALKWALLAYLDDEAFAHTRILDFGCGS